MGIPSRLQSLLENCVSCSMNCSGIRLDAKHGIIPRSVLSLQNPGFGTLGSRMNPCRQRRKSGDGGGRRLLMS